jgi:DNA-binding transcriptional LysR family regulator
VLFFCCNIVTQRESQMDVMHCMAVFRRVAEASSFSAVARETGQSQSTVSKHVAALEQRLGTKLLNRSTRQLSLTEAGSEYYHYCVRILNDFQEAEASVGRGKILPTGTLRVSTTAAFSRRFILPNMGDFLQKYPDINIELHLDDRYVDLVKEGVDLAVRIGPLADSSLIARRIGVCPRVVVASPAYLQNRAAPRTPAELQMHECLIYTNKKAPNEWFFNGIEGDESVRVDGRFRSSCTDTIADATMAGLGIAVLCEWHVRESIKQGRLRVLMRDSCPTPYKVHAVYAERRFVPQKVRRLIEFLQHGYRNTDD